MDFRDIEFFGVELLNEILESVSLDLILVRVLGYEVGDVENNI